MKDENSGLIFINNEIENVNLEAGRDSNQSTNSKKKIEEFQFVSKSPLISHFEDENLSGDSNVDKLNDINDLISNSGDQTNLNRSSNRDIISSMRSLKSKKSQKNNIFWADEVPTFKSKTDKNSSSSKDSNKRDKSGLEIDLNLDHGGKKGSSDFEKTVKHN